MNTSINDNVCKELSKDIEGILRDACDRIVARVSEALAATTPSESEAETPESAEEHTEPEVPVAENKARRGRPAIPLDDDTRSALASGSLPRGWGRKRAYAACVRNGIDPSPFGTEATPKEECAPSPSKKESVMSARQSLVSGPFRMSGDMVRKKMGWK